MTETPDHAPDDTPDARTDPEVDEILAEQAEPGSREQISMPPEEGTADDPASFLER